MKSNGSVVSYGDKQEHLSNLVALQIFTDGVRITDPLDWNHVYNTSANDVVVGYRGYGDLPGVTYDTSSEPKTIMGIGGTANSNGRYNKVYIYSSRKDVTRNYAVSLLADSGAIASIVLDSGGSALLTAKGTKLVYGRTGMSSARPVPHAIGIVSGSNVTGWTTGSYSNNEDRSQILSISGATSLNVIVRGVTESRYDFLYIYDQNGQQVKKLDGSINETFTVSGSSITARLVTDYSVTKSGVTVSIVSGGETNQNDPDIEYFYNQYPNYFGAKSGGNYSCYYSAYTCQDFSNGKKIAVYDQNKSLYWYTDGSWHTWRNNY